MKTRGRLLFLCSLALLTLWLIDAIRRRGIRTDQTQEVAATNASTQVDQSIHQFAAKSNNTVSRTQVHAPASSQDKPDQLRHDTEQEVELWKSPVLYYGKVVDESNTPIPGVVVSYSASSLNDLRFEVQNSGTATSDARGIFQISGIRGIGLMFQLSHPEYYTFPENPTGFDKRSLPKKGYFSDTEEKADLFRMHQKGTPVALVHRRGGADVPVGGVAATVKLFGKEQSQLIGTLQIQAFGDTPKNWSPQPYDWSARFTMPGGGLLEFTNRFDFVAPDAGYQESIELNMSKNDPDWSDTVEKQYFVKLAAGYARIAIRVRAKTPLFVSLEYFFNPDGSRNLEPAN